MVTAITKMKEGLAKEVYEDQVLHGWQGLAQDVGVICATTGIPNANYNIVSKKDLNVALRNHYSKEILEKFANFKKLDKILGYDPTKAKDYMMDK